MTDGLEPVEAAALRRILHQGAAAVSEDPAAVDEMSPVEKADLLLDRITSVEDTVREVAERTYLLTLLSDDGPSKRARKVKVVEHLIEKAEATRSGKSHVDTETASAVAECSKRQARTHLDELAEQVPGFHLKTPDEVGAGKQLRIDLETFRTATPHAEALPPRESP